MIFAFQCYSHLVVVDNVELVVCALQEKKKNENPFGQWKSFKIHTSKPFFVLRMNLSAITLRPITPGVNKRQSHHHYPFRKCGILWNFDENRQLGRGISKNCSSCEVSAAVWIYPGGDLVLSRLTAALGGRSWSDMVSFYLRCIRAGVVLIHFWESKSGINQKVLKSRSGYHWLIKKSTAGTIMCFKIVLTSKMALLKLCQLIKNVPLKLWYKKLKIERYLS